MTPLVWAFAVSVDPELKLSPVERLALLTVADRAGDSDDDWDLGIYAFSCGVTEQEVERALDRLCGLHLVEFRVSQGLAHRLIRLDMRREVIL
jgi:hypothetical protein